MNTRFVSSGYCGLLAAVIAKAYPQAVRSGEITYEAGISMSPMPQVFSLSKDAAFTALNDPFGYAQLALFGLLSTGAVFSREDGFRVIPVGVSLFIELENQTQDLSSLITHAELLDVLGRNGRKPIGYSLSMVSVSHRRFTEERPSVKDIRVFNHVLPPSENQMVFNGRQDDVLGAFFQMTRESERIESPLRAFIRRLMAVPEFN